MKAVEAGSRTRLSPITRSDKIAAIEHLALDTVAKPDTTPTISMPPCSTPSPTVRAITRWFIPD
jgi:hypothetical protein